MQAGSAGRGSCCPAAACCSCRIRTHLSIAAAPCSCCLTVVLCLLLLSRPAAAAAAPAADGVTTAIALRYQLACILQRPEPSRVTLPPCPEGPISI
jgi:hypothetical protein